MGVGGVGFGGARDAAVAAAAGRPRAAADLGASAGRRGAAHQSLSVLSACGTARQAGAAAAS